MGGKRFDVLLREAISGTRIQKEWNTDQVLKNVAWLQRMNARGHNIFIRPSGEHGLALLDALNGNNFAKMSCDGLVPAVSIEIACNEFEAWVKLSHSALPAELRCVAKSELMGLIVDARVEKANDEYGRLAGFVNFGNGRDGVWRPSYVLAHAGSAEISLNAAVCLERARMVLKGRKKNVENNASIEILISQANPRGHRL